jgi:hypothetical protein
VSEYPSQPFAEFLARFDWRQGEHVLIAAPTSAGKSTLAAKIAPKRGHVVVLVSKSRDDHLRRLFGNYTRIDTWPPRRDADRVLLWPRPKSTAADTIAHQQSQFAACLDDVQSRGGWCVVVDECHYATEFLGLGRPIAVLHHQGRSSGVSMVVLTQRPAWIPRIIYSSASHVFLGATAGDRDDSRALASLGGRDSKRVAEHLETLPKHDLVYLNPMGSARSRIVNTRR